MTTRDKIVQTTARLLWTQGYAATGLNQIIEESGAPRGSVYFHFRGGKQELAAVALEAAGAVITVNIREALGHRTTRTAIRKYVAAYTKELEESDYKRGCPIATVAMEAAGCSPKISAVCEEIFAEWQALLAARLVRDGLSRRRAEDLAVFILSAIEGGLLLCKTRQSAAPLRAVGRQIDAILAS